MASHPYNLADFNIAFMGSSYLDHEKLRPFSNPRGRRPAGRGADSKPLVTSFFVELLLPDEFCSIPSWRYAYVAHRGSSALLKLMTGSPDGLSTHRKTLSALARNGFTVCESTDVLMLSALREKAARFLADFTKGPADPIQTLTLWETESERLAAVRPVPPSIRDLLSQVRALAGDGAHAPEALAGMLLAGLLCGISASDEPLCADWAEAFRRWRDSGFPATARPDYRPDREAARLKRHYAPLCAHLEETLFPEILPPLDVPLAPGIPAAQLTIFTGTSGSGRQAHIQRLFLSVQGAGDLIPLYLDRIGEDGLLSAAAKHLRMPQGIGWRTLGALLGDRSLMIFIPNLMMRPNPDALVRDIADALDTLPGGTLRFVLTTAVIPFEFQGFTRTAHRCLPLTDEQKAGYLQKKISPQALEGLRQDAVVWKLLSIPANLVHYTEPSDAVCSDVPFLIDNPRTAPDLLYNYLIGFTVPGGAATGHNASVLYLLPALAAEMTFLGVDRISHRRAVSFWSDQRAVRALHLEPLTRYRFAFSGAELPARYEALVRMGLLVSRGGTYTFAQEGVQMIGCAIHSLNLFDIELKDNVAIDGSYPYDAHTDYFWQLLSSGQLRHYERMLPPITYDDTRFDVARLYTAWSVVIFYGNGSDEPGCVDASLPEDRRKEHFWATLERAADIQEPLAKNTHFPGPAWNYIYYKKRIGEHLAAGENEERRAAGRACLEEAFILTENLIRYFDEHPDAFDISYARKHLYDKYAQFLMERPYPIEAVPGGYRIPGLAGTVSEKQLKREILRCLEAAAGEDNAVSINRLGLMALEEGPDRRRAYALFQRSAALGDIFAKGMVCSLLLDAPEELLSEPLPVRAIPAAPVGIRTLRDARDAGLLPDCCISYIREGFDADAYRSIVSDSRKSRYGTPFHQLGRAYLLKGDRENALRYLDAAAAMDWSQNDNPGEYERLLADRERAVRLSGGDAG